MPSTNHPRSAGTPAPAFSLHATPDQRVALEEFRGHPVILAFYPADWSPVCGDQMTRHNEMLPIFRRFHADLLGINPGADGILEALEQLPAGAHP